MAGGFRDVCPESRRSASGDGERLGPLVAALAGAAELAAQHVGASHDQHVAVAADEELEDQGRDGGITHDTLASSFATRCSRLFIRP